MIADLHLSHSPPRARRAEPDWYEAMARPIRELRSIRQGLEEKHDCELPVLVAGDLFDHWNEPAQLITFVMEELPCQMIVVPGQHDLPYHRLDDLHRSALATLAADGLVKILRPGEEYFFGDKYQYAVNGFPFGCELGPWPINVKASMKIMLAHRYCWTDGQGYPGAPDSGRPVKMSLGSYDVAVFGDNHRHFSTVSRGCEVYNCGRFIRRRADERSGRPAVGILYGDGKVGYKYLMSCEEDKWSDDDGENGDTDLGSEVVKRLGEFVRELATLGERALDFPEAVRRYLDRDDVEDDVRRMLVEVLEKLAERR
jgi:hypothetical protein